LSPPLFPARVWAPLPAPPPLKSRARSLPELAPGSGRARPARSRRGAPGGGGAGRAAGDLGRVQTPPRAGYRFQPTWRPAAAAEEEARKEPPRHSSGSARLVGFGDMWAPGGPPGLAGWDRRRLGARLRAALAGLLELQGLRAAQQERVRDALALQSPPAPAAPCGPHGHEQQLEAALAAVQEQLVRTGRRGRRGTGVAGVGDRGLEPVQRRCVSRRGAVDAGASSGFDSVSAEGDTGAPRRCLAVKRPGGDPETGPGCSSHPALRGYAPTHASIPKPADFGETPVRL
ncbi:hypothetical protein P7K49_009020, partial [Saguinus oedipus]